MRARNIKPGFFKNSKLGHLPPLARILFSGLWCLADRAGRLEDDFERIKVEVLPYDKTNVQHLLELLNENGFITKYESNDVKYIQINTFSKHQNPHIREISSTLPDKAQCQHSASTSLAPLIPSSLIPDSGFSDITGKSPKVRLLPVRDWFESLWRRYPRRDGRKLAERSFYASVKSEEDWQDIQRALANYIRSEVVKKGYIKNGSTWFGNWRDWINSGEDKNASDGSQSISEQVAERIRESQSSKDRTEPTPGEVLARVRNLPKIQPQAQAPPGGGNREDATALGNLRENSIAGGPGIRGHTPGNHTEVKS